MEVVEVDTQQRQYVHIDKLSSNIPPSYIYSTQPHSSSSPLVHTLHSEWIDTPANSPSKMLYTRVYETPLKQQKYQNFATDKKGAELVETIGTQLVTPLSTHKPAAGPAGSNSTSLSNSMTNAGNVVVPENTNAQALVRDRPSVHQMDIFWSMLNDIVGKDKMAKFGQYTLRLLIYWANKSENYLSDSQINFKSISLRYNDREKKLNLLMNFLKHPQNFIRIIAILVCSIFSSRFAGMVKGLSMYRQFLRFGKTPFRVRNLYNKLRSAIIFDKEKQLLDLSHFQAKFLTNSTLGELAGLYYGVSDETLLLYKLDFLTNKPLHALANRHESLAWYSETILGLYNAYENLQNLSQKEIELKIQIQVKSRSRVLSKQLLGGTITTMDTHLGDEKDLLKLKEIQFKKTNIYLDIYKGASDFFFNSYTVFNSPLPFATLQIWLGISASSFSIIKLYRETKKKLEAKAALK